MSAAHWPTLDLGVHVPDDPEGGWRMAPLGTFRAQAVCDGRVLPGPTRTWTAQMAPGTQRRVAGRLWDSSATQVALGTKNAGVTLTTRPESFHS